MSFHSKGSTVTFKWVILPTGSPPAKTAFDVLRILPNQTAGYTNDGVTTYVAPTATTQGRVTYDLPLNSLGRYQVILAAGVASAFIVDAFREVFSVDVPPHVLDGSDAKLIQGPEIFPSRISQGGNTQGDPDWANIQIYGVGYDGDDTVLVGLYNYTTNTRLMYMCGVDLLDPVSLSMSDITGWTNGIFQEFAHIQWSPELSRWVAYTGRGEGFYCDGDPSVGANWLPVVIPTNRPTMGSYINVRIMLWSPQLQMFVTMQDGQFSDTLEVSVDGINWFLWSDYFTFTSHPNRLSTWFEGTVNGTLRILGFAIEGYKHRSSNTGAGVLPDVAQNWFETTVNGVIQNTGQSSIFACVTDGSVVVVNNAGQMNASDLSLSHPSAWGPSGNSNIGWVDSDMGFATTGGGTMTSLMYLPQFSKPWKLFRTAPSTPTTADHGWWESASIPYTPAARAAGNAPTWNYIGSGGDEPFASINDDFINNNNFHFPGSVQIGFGSQWSIYGFGSKGTANMGSDGWYIVMRTDINRNNDYLIFNAPSEIIF